MTDPDCCTMTHAELHEELQLASRQRDEMKDSLAKAAAARDAAKNDAAKLREEIVRRDAFIRSERHAPHCLFWKVGKGEEDCDCFKRDYRELVAAP